MADPHLQPELDGFDRFTVRAYRSGLFLAAGGVAAVGVASLGGRMAPLAWWAVLVGTVMSVGHLHLYDKRVRWLVQWLCWAGLLVRALASIAPAPALPWIGGWSTGLVLAALGVVVVKEWFCFRIPGVRWTPLALAVGVFARFFGHLEVAGGALLLASLGVLAVAIAKARMPLGHDIGDRTAYQI